LRVSKAGSVTGAGRTGTPKTTLQIGKGGNREKASRGGCLTSTFITGRAFRTKSKNPVEKPGNKLGRKASRRE